MLWTDITQKSLGIEMANATALMMLACAWIIYFALHSLLASNRIKRHFARLRCYRLIYNLIALITLLPIVTLHILYEGESVIQWREPWKWLAQLLSVGAIACFIWTLRYYDLGEFSGWSHCRDDGRVTKTRLVISPPHRFVRHPWYSCALILIWCRDMDLAQLISTILISGYLVIGSHIEERRLIAEFGDSYREYRQSVPGMIPLPWKRLSRERSRQLMNQQDSVSQ